MYLSLVFFESLWFVYGHLVYRAHARLCQPRPYRAELPQFGDYPQIYIYIINLTDISFIIQIWFAHTFQRLTLVYFEDSW